MRRALASFAFVSMGLSALTVVADPPGLKPLAIGSPAPDFQLPGVDGKSLGLKDFAASKVLVVAFTCNHCPTANAYEARFKKFVEDYKDRGVSFVAISPNDPQAVRLDELGYSDLDDSFESMKIRARDHHYNFPYLYDGETQATSRAYGVLATPHLFIFDADRKLRYQGRFDDSEVKAVTSHDAINAVEALLAGKSVPVETTRVPGCSTKWADKRESARQWLAKADAEPVKLEMIDEAGVAKLAKNDSQDLLVVNVWATWCGPCLERAPRAGQDQPDVPGPRLQDDHREHRRPGQEGGSRVDPRQAPRLVHQLPEPGGEPGQARLGPRQGVARPRALHDRHRPRRQGDLPEVQRDRPPRTQAGDRRIPQADLLRPHRG